MPSFNAELEERLVRYCAIDSQSDVDSASEPSTEIQLDMARLLVEELKEIGAEDIELTDYGTVLATIPGTAPGPTIGFLAHVDTAPQFRAEGVKPRVIRGYNGGEITYPDDADLVLSPESSPYLAEKVGEDIVTASGLTLLGADDKAGVAIVMAAARHLIETGAPRPRLRLAFTPDEEIGRGAHEKLPKDLGADFAYTFDGQQPPVIQYETFSADAATVRLRGVSIHPGLSKDKLVNALTLGAKLLMTLPQQMTPEGTDGKQGFIMAGDIEGDAAEVRIRFILRDFERDGLEQKGEILRKACAAIQAGEPRAVVTCEITPQYRNMRYWLEEDMTPVDLAADAARDIGIEPEFSAIRGGTDGSRLTEMGVPCPNLFTGMQNIHGPLEWISIQDMGRATELMLAIAARAAAASD
ncbi:peptidase T [Pseudoroseicyclus tamaricis]|uniref:Peptidase T n=1 Tax=Pseudoroseicyclus tamaricis TaxID=2705421 RepID=A0A6B2K0W2_9RHOB|nr:peptidase T [Pseudoroseicyclus tamaricis]NDU99955.1 peptidase T [Pseudoroseicyclus tamaricis]